VALQHNVRQTAAAHDVMAAPAPLAAVERLRKKKCF
jgi:hypothetical protein